MSLIGLWFIRVHSSAAWRQPRLTDLLIVQAGSSADPTRRQLTDIASGGGQLISLCIG